MDQAIVVLHLDAVPAFRDNPKEFGEAVLAALVKATDSFLPVTSPLNSYADCITAHPPRHVGIPALYLLQEGSCTELTGKHFMDLAREKPECARGMLDSATSCINETKYTIASRRGPAGSKPRA